MWTSQRGKRMKRVNGSISIIYAASLVGCIYLGYLIGGASTTEVEPIKQEATDNRVFIEVVAAQNKVIIRHQEKMEKIVEYLFKYELGTPVPKFEEEEGKEEEN